MLCPICGNKTRDRIREDTILRNYPLYCPKCKKETILCLCSTNFNCNLCNFRLRGRNIFI
ncbi:MAG: hypothetical protein HFE79_02055 [Ruminiclostridium sp.]|nr:hypothetical protein [Ruminiclostridium sp.]